MASIRKKVKEKIEDEDMKKWAIEINALSDMPISEWEQDFLESISHWMDKGYRLTEKQAETLEKIYRKHF